MGATVTVMDKWMTVLRVHSELVVMAVYTSGGVETDLAGGGECENDIRQGASKRQCAARPPTVRLHQKRGVPLQRAGWQPPNVDARNDQSRITRHQHVANLAG